MAMVACVDGSVLSVLPVPAIARDGVPYEVTLRLLRDGEAFGEVGERCGFFLAASAARVRAALAVGEESPPSSLERGVRAWAADRAQDAAGSWRDLQKYLPRDRELFCFRSRDPDDLATVGELRVTLQVERSWVAPAWRTTPLAVLEAWGTAGQGLRAVLSSEQLLSFLEALVQEFADVGAAYSLEEGVQAVRRPVS